MRPREVTSLFQTTARAWLSLALVSLALPVRWRLGLWLPLHLTLAGAASTAIAGAMPNFVLAMTASAGPSTSVVRIRAGLLAAGVLALATGMVTGWSPLVAIGGTSFAASMAMLGHLVWRAWRTSLVRRRGVFVAGYGIAVGCVLVGATLGGLIGSGAVVDGVAQVRRAHAVLNVLGFVSLTVVATLVTSSPRCSGCGCRRADRDRPSRGHARAWRSSRSAPAPGGRCRSRWAGGCSPSARS